MDYRTEESAQLFSIDNDNAVGREREIENIPANERALSTEICDVFVVDGECLIPELAGRETEESLANIEENRIYNDYA